MSKGLQNSTKDKIQGTFLILTAAVLWGTAFAVRKQGMSDIGPIMQNAMRFFSAFCFMLLVLAVREAAKKHRREEKLTATPFPLSLQIRYGAILGALFGTGEFLQQLGLTTVPAGKVGFITSLYMIMVPLISRLFFKDKIHVQVWWGMAISFLGLVFITSGSMGIEPGYILLISGAVLYALQMILAGRYVKGADVLVLATVQSAMGFVVNLVMAYIMQEFFAFYMVRDAMTTILYTGVLALGVANLCQFLGQKKLQPSVTAIICSFESVFGLAAGMVLLGEGITVKQALGSVLILFAIIIAQLNIKDNVAKKRKL